MRLSSLGLIVPLLFFVPSSDVQGGGRVFVRSRCISPGVRRRSGGESLVRERLGKWSESSGSLVRLLVLCSADPLIRLTSIHLFGWNLRPLPQKRVQSTMSSTATALSRISPQTRPVTCHRASSLQVCAGSTRAWDSPGWAGARPWPASPEARASAEAARRKRSRWTGRNAGVMRGRKHRGVLSRIFPFL